MRIRIAEIEANAQELRESNTLSGNLSNLLRRIFQIITGVNGEQYPCKPDIFEKTYEEVSDDCLQSAQPERAIKDCRNCKFGGYNDHWNTNFCYCSDDCNNWDKWEPSAQPDLDEWCTTCKEYDQERHCCPRWNRVIKETLMEAQPEPSIPLQWIEAHIEWLKSLDNAFATLTAKQISAMVNKWKDEQDDTEG